MGSIVALLIRAGWRDRGALAVASPSPPPESRGPRPVAPLAGPAREDVLERYRLAAAV